MNNQTLKAELSAWGEHAKLPAFAETKLPVIVIKSYFMNNVGAFDRAK